MTTIDKTIANVIGAFDAMRAEAIRDAGIKLPETGYENHMEVLEAARASNLLNGQARKVVAKAAAQMGTPKDTLIGVAVQTGLAAVEAYIHSPLAVMESWGSFFQALAVTNGLKAAGLEEAGKAYDEMMKEEFKRAKGAITAFNTVIEEDLLK